jgi:hypothetical protein
MKTSVLTAVFVATLSLGAAEPVANGSAVTEAAVSGFLASLTSEERVAAGVEKLSAEQRGVLGKLADKEVRLARQGDTRGFAGTFISRRSEEERSAAGLGINSIAWWLGPLRRIHPKRR